MSAPGSNLRNEAHQMNFTWDGSVAAKCRCFARTECFVCGQCIVGLLGFPASSDSRR